VKVTCRLFGHLWMPKDWLEGPDGRITPLHDCARCGAYNPYDALVRQIWESRPGYKVMPDFGVRS
jgi:hypothetical protein